MFKTINSKVSSTNKKSDMYVKFLFADFTYRTKIAYKFDISNTEIYDRFLHTRY